MKRFYTFFRFYVMCMLLTCVFTLSAQTSFNYSTGFETAQERAGWTFVNDATNAWAFGTAVARTNTNNSSLNSMYISTDNGVTTGYNNAVAAVSMAYYTVTLPVGGEYAVTFDWRARGEVNSDLLSVCLVDNPAEVIAAGAASTLPSPTNPF